MPTSLEPAGNLRSRRLESLRFQLRCRPSFPQICKGDFGCDFVGAQGFQIIASIFLFFWDFCSGPVSHSVTGHFNRNLNIKNSLKQTSQASNSKMYVMLLDSLQSLSLNFLVINFIQRYKKGLLGHTHHHHVLLGGHVGGTWCWLPIGCPISVCDRDFWAILISMPPCIEVLTFWWLMARRLGTWTWQEAMQDGSIRGELPRMRQRVAQGVGLLCACSKKGKGYQNRPLAS